MKLEPKAFPNFWSDEYKRFHDIMKSRGINPKMMNKPNDTFKKSLYIPHIMFGLRWDKYDKVNPFLKEKAETIDKLCSKLELPFNSDSQNFEIPEFIVFVADSQKESIVYSVNLTALFFTSTGIFPIVCSMNDLIEYGFENDLKTDKWLNPMLIIHDILSGTKQQFEYQYSKIQSLLRKRATHGSITILIHNDLKGLESANDVIYEFRRYRHNPVNSVINKSDCLYTNYKGILH